MNPASSPLQGIPLFYDRHKKKLLIAGIAILVFFSCLKLSLEFYRLIFEPGWTGAVDLEMYYKGVHAWFDDEFVYTSSNAPYPSATFLMLWPFLGWLSLSAARWFWAFTSIVMLVWLVYLTVRESDAGDRLERAFVAFLPLSLNATGIVIGNGQLVLHILPVLISSMLLLRNSNATWWRDLIAAIGLAFSVIKPTIGVPFLWIALFLPMRFRPVLLAAVVYSFFSYISLQFRSESIYVHLSQWLVRGSNVAREGGYADIHTLLARAHLPQLIIPSSIVLFFLLGAWLFANRKIDLWMLLGVTALVARLWANHRAYDDLLILLPLIALFRIAKSESRRAIWSALLFLLTLAAMLAPARIAEQPWPYHLWITLPRAILWLSMLCFLVLEAKEQRILNRLVNLSGQRAAAP